MHRRLLLKDRKEREGQRAQSSGGQQRVSRSGLSPQQRTAQEVRRQIPAAAAAVVAIVISTELVGRHDGRRWCAQCPSTIVASFLVVGASPPRRWTSCLAAWSGLVFYPRRRPHQEDPEFFSRRRTDEQHDGDAGLMSRDA